MTLLTYTPSNGDDEPYHDEQRHHKYYAGTHDVPQSAVEDYLEHPGWERADADAAPSAFDAKQFLDDDWRDIVATIEGGGVDPHLETIRARERARTRGSGPRDSVLEAIEARLDEIVGSDSEGDGDA